MNKQEINSLMEQNEELLKESRELLDSYFILDTLWFWVIVLAPLSVFYLFPNMGHLVAPLSVLSFCVLIPDMHKMYRVSKILNKLDKNFQLLGK